MGFGLVLGAGGATGWVFHTGVLRTMEDEYGLDPADADVIVGTSAGSAVAAGLRAGLDAAEILAAITRPPTEDQRSAMLTAVKEAPKTVRPLSPRLARHALPGGKGLTLAVAGLLPPGWFPTSWLASLPGMAGFGETWPEGLWITAVRAEDGETVVFGRDRVDVPVHVAAQASSAVPGMFQPSVIDGEVFVDGGVTSSTHASLLAESGVGTVIVSAPMTKPSRRLFASHARRMLADEIEELRKAGIDTIVVRPTAEAMEAAKGFPRRNPGAAQAIVGHAAEATRLAFAAV